MWQAVRENPRAVFYAVLMHVGLLILLVISLDWTPKAVKPGSNKPIQAELVDASKLKAVKQKMLADQQKLADEKRKLEQDKQRKAEQAAKQKAEAERKKQDKIEASKKAEVERKQQAALAKKKKAEQAAKQKAAKQKAAKEKVAEEEAARAKAAAEVRQREAEQALQVQLAEEQAQAQAESALSQYIPYIQEKIQRNWIRPVGSTQGMSCLILVKLIPGGEVVDATVVRSSGDPLFDRSVETAVLKASPLPLPEDATMFKYFREINFNFNPDS